MTFSSCSDSDDDANQTKPADMVRLVSFHNELVKGMFVLTTHLDNVWENGRLMRQTQIASALGKSVEVGEVFTYNERGLCTEMYTAASRRPTRMAVLSCLPVTTATTIRTSPTMTGLVSGDP